MTNVKLGIILLIAVTGVDRGRIKLATRANPLTVLTQEFLAI